MYSNSIGFVVNHIGDTSQTIQSYAKNSKSVTWSNFWTMLLSTMAGSDAFTVITLDENDVHGSELAYESVAKHSNIQWTS